MPAGVSSSVVPVPAGVSSGVVVPAGVSSGVVVPAGVSAGVVVVSAGVSAGVVVSVPPCPPCWQADRPVTKPSRSRTINFDFTVKTLGLFKFLDGFLSLQGI